MSKIFVIAGTRAEADQWIKGNLEKRKLAGETTLSLSEYVVVKDPTVLRGYRNPSGYFIGTWKQRKDLDGIFQLLLMATDITSNRHRKLNQMWGEWQEANPKPTPKIINNPKGFTSMFGNNQSVEAAADLLAKEIDAEVIRTLNGGNVQNRVDQVAITQEQLTSTMLTAIQELKKEIEALKYERNLPTS